MNEYMNNEEINTQWFHKPVWLILLCCGTAFYALHDTICTGIAGACLNIDGADCLLNSLEAGLFVAVIALSPDKCDSVN